MESLSVQCTTLFQLPTTIEGRIMVIEHWRYMYKNANLEDLKTCRMLNLWADILLEKRETKQKETVSDAVFREEVCQRIRYLFCWSFGNKVCIQ